MSEAESMRRAPASQEAIARAAAFMARAYRDESEALLALELAFEDAMIHGAETARQEERP